MPRGMTALLDAVGKTINTVESGAQPDEKILVLIITDGYENHSKEYNYEQIKKMISDKDALDNWTFVFLGATADAWNQGSSFGISASNVARFSYATTDSAWNLMASGTACLSRLAENKTSCFYNSTNEYTDI
jgi:hypothetical protein